MKRAIGFFVCMVLVFELGVRMMGYSSAYKVGYGAISIMGVIIALTFLWLWWVRATPLALGMAFSWAGSGTVMGWWWSYSILDRPEAMHNNKALFVFLSLYIVGALMHFHVIQQALSLPRNIFWLPVGGATLVSVLVWGWIG